VEIPGFQANLPTIYCNNVSGGMIVQVTSMSIRLVDCSSLQLLWEFIANKTITAATGSLTKLIVTLSGGEIHYFELKTKQYEMISSVTLDQDVACMSFYGFIQQKQQQFSSSSMEVDDNDDDEASHLQQLSNLLAVGMWTDNSIRLLTLPTLQEVTRTVLQSETQARDLLLASFEKKIHLFIGLGDGNLISYNVELSNGLPVINNRRKGVLGTHPIKFTPFKTIDNELCVFAACDRPTVIYMRNGKLLFSIVNLQKNSKEVTEMTQFHSELFPDCLALCSETNLLIGTVEDIQKIHIQTIPLGEAPRRIAHCNVANVYAGKKQFFILVSNFKLFF
jgi:DNA damage-binding protein 1